eukprot:149088_1
MSSNRYKQRHYPEGSGGCIRDVIIGNDGTASVKRTNGSMKAMDNKIQQAIKNAIQNNQDKAIYTFNGEQYYIDLNEVVQDSEDEKKEPEDSDISDVEDLLNDGEEGLVFVGNGAGQKVDIPFDTQQTVRGLKQSFADKMQCEAKEIEILAYINGKFIEVENQTLAANEVFDPKTLIVCQKDDRKEAVKRLIRAHRWEDDKFRKEAKKLLKQSGLGAGKQGVDNLIKKNGLEEGWNDVLSQMNYKDVMKIIKDDNIMSRIDKIRMDANYRKSFNITDEQVSKLTFQQVSKMQRTTHGLREQFYEDMSKIALKGSTMVLNKDCAKFFDQFTPGEKGTNGETIGFFGVISLIDGKELKAMGIQCKNVDSIKQGQFYAYPSQPHNKQIKLGDRVVKGDYVNPNKGGTGHQQLCDIIGIPSEYCAGYAITPPTLKFRSGTCNQPKHGKINGFNNGRALNNVLQDCLKKAFTNTKATEFYNKIDSSA